MRGLVAGLARSRLSGLMTPLLESLAGTPPGTLNVLTYHRVDDPRARPWLYPGLLSASPATFEDQMRLIADSSRVVSLPEVVSAQRGQSKLPERAVLITFDDAYRDFGESVAPIVAKLGIPVTLFVPTGYPDTGTEFWWDRIWNVLGTRPAEVERVFELDLRERTRDRVRAAAYVIEHAKGLPRHELMSKMARLGDSENTTAHREPSVLRWQELRELAANGVMLAPHTRTHPVLPNMSSEDIEQELESSRRDLLAVIPEHSVSRVAFAYPAGRYDTRVLRSLSHLGFELAFTTERGTNRIGRTDPFRLRRINVGTRANAQLIRTQMVLGTLQRRIVPR